MKFIDLKNVLDFSLMTTMAYDIEFNWIQNISEEFHDNSEISILELISSFKQLNLTQF